MREEAPPLAETHPLRSLQWRFPAAVAAILVSTVVGVLGAVEWNLERTLVAAAIDRARQANDEIVDLLGPPAVRGLDQLKRRAAETPAFQDYLTDPSPSHAEAARDAMRTLVAGGPREIVLWPAGASEPLRVSVPAADPNAAVRALSPIQRRPPAGIGPLVPDADGFDVDLAADVTGSGNRPIGTLVVRSRIVLSPPGIISRLIGSRARALLGAGAGDAWLDLASMQPARQAIDWSRDVGVQRPIAGTPWIAAVAFDRAEVIRAARQLMQRLALSALVATALAALLVRALTHTITARLIGMTAAARAIAGYDYSQRLDVRGRDEIAQLGDAFNRMAQQIEDAQRRLQERIIERTQTLDALAESEARLRAIIDVAFDAIVTIDAAGTVTEFNAAAEKMFGYRRADAIGRELAALIVPPPTRDRHRAGLARYAETGRGTIVNRLIELTAMRADGTEFPVEVAITRVHGEGPLALTGVVRDVTERKSTEAQLRQAQKMEAIGQLAGGVAHDFNNLLTAILGYTNLLLEDLPEGSPARADVLHIQTAGESAADLTRQLLAFSRQQVLEPRVVNVNEVVHRVESLLTRLIGEDIQLQTMLAPDLRHIRADPGQLEQILLNLAVNARDAMPKGGRLSIETSNVDLDERHAARHASDAVGQHIMLAVSDTGVGMDRETQSKIFEPFFTTKERGKGTGLGLSTVFGIVQQSGGSIWVYSEPGEGTTFKVYLPAAPSDLERAPSAAEPATLRGSETILLAEDEPAVRTATRAMLERGGYTVIEAVDGEDAWRRITASTRPIHLLLTDVVMPMANGRDLALRLKAIRPDIRVLYASGYTDDTVIRHGLVEAGFAFLQKPYSLEALLRKVRQVLDQPRAGPHP